MNSKPQNYAYPLAILTTLFFAWGFITAMNDVLIPYLKGAFDLSYSQSLLVQFAFFSAYFFGSLIYFIVSSTSGDPIAKIGYKNGLILGLIIAAIGCGLFYPAAEYKVYEFFLGALFTLGLGLTLLQIAANPYVTLLGRPETASSRLNFTQGFNSFGTTIAPPIGAYLIYEYFKTGSEVSIESVKPLYIFLAVAFLLLAAMIKSATLPKKVSSDNSESTGGESALRYSNLVFGIGAIFCYVGAEVAIGSFLVNFLGLEDIMGLEEGEAARLLALYWGGAMIGRFAGSISMNNSLAQGNKIVYMVFASGLQKPCTQYMVFASGLLYVVITLVSGLSFGESAPFLLFIAINLVLFLISKGMPSRTLAVFALLAASLLVVGVVMKGEVAMWAILAIGLFNSIMWSNIFALSIAGLGNATSQGSSLLVMAILGGALVPYLQANIADASGLQVSFLVPVACYAYLVFFGLIGSRPGKFQ